MTVETITVPNFEFGIFYADILRQLRRFAANNVPELTEDSDEEPFNQLLAAFALTGHLNNVAIDMAANESTLQTAALVDSIRAHLSSRGYDLQTAAPAVVDMLFQLTSAATSDVIVAEGGSRISIDSPTIRDAAFFELDETIAVTPTENFDFLIGELTFEQGYDDASASLGNLPYPILAILKALYVGSSSVMFNAMSGQFEAPLTPNFTFNGVWEYYQENTDRSEPDTVEQTSNGLAFELNDYLGISDRSGASVRVRLKDSQIYSESETIFVDGKNVLVIPDFLGQADPSDRAEDYIVGSNWEELELETGENFGFESTYNLRFELPQDATRNWAKTTINGSNGFFIRFRVIRATSSTAPPLFLSSVSMQPASQFVIGRATQGRSFLESPLGSSTGLADQVFLTTQQNYIDAGRLNPDQVTFTDSSVLTVDGVEWTRVKHFVRSRPTDQHYMVRFTRNARAEIVFSNGTQGGIPPTGNGNIEYSYRYGAQADGNVAQRTITNDESGLSRIARVYNPRPAFGWAAEEGSSPASLEIAKQIGPAIARTRDVAHHPEDVERFAIRFRSDAGSRPFSRARAVEEMFGPKTVGLVLVPTGGTQQIDADSLEEISVFFNGDRNAVPRQPRRVTSNQRVVPILFTAKQIALDVLVHASGVSEDQVRNALLRVLDPESRVRDVTSVNPFASESDAQYEWQFGEDVTISRLSHEVHSVSPAIVKVEFRDPSDVALPQQDIILTRRELPVANRADISVQIVPPVDR